MIETPTCLDHLADVKRFFIFGGQTDAHELRHMLCARFNGHFFGFFSLKDPLHHDPKTGYPIRPLRSHMDDLTEGDYVFILQRDERCEQGLAERGIRMGYAGFLLSAYQSYEAPSFQVFLDRFFDRKKRLPVALDIGANFGLTAAMMEPYFKRVVAFEPNRSIFENLCKNHTLQNTIELREVALGAEPGTADFVDAEGVNGSLVIGDKTANYLVEVDTLDNLCMRENLRPDFIKIDAEGMDCDIILNGKNILESYKPIIFFESPADDTSMSSIWHETKRYLSEKYDLLAFQCMKKLFPIDKLGSDLTAFEQSETLAALNVAAIPR